jgi:cytoskeletal protein RodZ
MSSRDDQARPAGVGPGGLRRPSITRPRLPAGIPGDAGRLMGRVRGERPPAPVRPAEPPLGERLAAAREHKGVDLARAERDTKIRMRYLAALERGDYRDLPGAVYTKGFLRNYALYLGLDPDDVLRQWRRERGEVEVEPVVVVPRGLDAPRPTLTIGRGTIFAVLLAVGVVLFVGYLGVQLFRFSQPPSIAITDPLNAVIDVDPSATAYTLRGTTTAGATVSIETPGRETVRVTAGPDGRWSAQVELVRGRNQFDVTATDSDTGKTSPAPATVYITVPYGAAAAPVVTLDSPADGATFENGAVPVTGVAKGAETVTVSAAYLGPPAGAPASAKSATPPPAPKPVKVDVAGDGAFTVPLQLASGRWTLTITARSPQDQSTTLTRAVTVAFSGVSVVVKVEGGKARITAWVDGKADARTGAAGKVIADGKSLAFTGAKTVEVRSSDPSVTYVTVNGKDLGVMADSTETQSWIYAPRGAPKRSTRE